MVEVHNLEFTYPGATSTTLKGFSFGIDQGEVLGFLGPSGAGKSTTQKILIGLLKDFKGEVAVLGQDLRRITSAYYERIGVSFETPNHYLKLTARENLTYYGALYSGATRDIDELLGLVGLEQDADMLVSQFSKGMKNRLNVARALLHDPELLFMDEPTAGLDPLNARRVKDLILELKQQGKTIFLSTHDMTVANELSDRVAFIVDGDVSVIDTPRNLRLQHGKREVKVEFQRNGTMASASFPLDGLGENTAFQALLQTDAIETIHTQEPTLETIFIEVTGRRLA